MPRKRKPETRLLASALPALLAIACAGQVPTLDHSLRPASARALEAGDLAAAVSREEAKPKAPAPAALKPKSVPSVTHALVEARHRLETVLRTWKREHKARQKSAQREIASVDRKEKKDRLAQAREILGSEFRRSVVRRDFSNDAIHRFVEARVRGSLPRKWRKKAHAVAQAIVDESLRYHFDPVLLMAIIQTESRFRPGIRGHDGELGLMQVMPATGEWVSEKFDLPWRGRKTLLDPVMNVRIGAAYLSLLREEYEPRGPLYLAAYNMGSSSVQECLSRKVWPRDYALRVKKNYLTMYREIQKS